jgi:hypothetical protein
MCQLFFQLIIGACAAAPKSSKHGSFADERLGFTKKATGKNHSAETPFSAVLPRTERQLPQLLGAPWCIGRVAMLLPYELLIIAGAATASPAAFAEMDEAGSGLPPRRPLRQRGNKLRAWAWTMKRS